MRAMSDERRRGGELERPEVLDLDRAAIFARRAALLSSALAALSCSQGTTTVQVDPAAGASQALPSATARPATPGAAALDAWPAVLAAAPPRGASPGAPSLDRNALASLDNDLARVYDAFSALWAALPVGCPLDAPGCEAEWSKLREHLGKAEQALEAFEPLCGWGPERSIVRQRRAAHEAYLRARRADVDRHLTGLATSPAARERLAALLEARLVTLRPCLSCVAPPDADLASERVRFDEGLSTLSGHEATLKALAARFSKLGSPRLEVRGHASAGEGGDAQALSKARAEAVAAELVRLGAAKAQLVVVPLGAELPVDNDSRRDGRAANRRVDFELVP